MNIIMRTFKKSRGKSTRVVRQKPNRHKKTARRGPKKPKKSRKGTKKRHSSKKKGKKPLSDWNKLVKETLQSMKKEDPNVSLKDALKEASKRRKKQI